MTEDQEHQGPPQMLDPLVDMEEIRIGAINYFHHGLHARIPLPGNRMMYGQIVFTSHSEFSSKLTVKWNGEQMETKAHPEHIIRIEATP
ncbi:hypothetical protein DFO58_3286 [Arthrobacter sp. AG1021]|uniref:hypothetical protein n=1 Tax=Arthrobacter sp. AG1021 TaxID=2183908 RepID=UPI000EB51F53|nr:hypothetical protein [Arthrobacter sp. AG1021]RKS16729.1 hypothetical protein DFO58_3286 [Arthrobacter sp. AG1021]